MPQFTERSTVSNKYDHLQQVLANREMGQRDGIWDRGREGTERGVRGTVTEGMRDTRRGP